MASIETAAPPSDAVARYEPVIGLEVHVQLMTHTKLFCACATEYGGQPNSQVCPVCLGLPGALPVVNGEALAVAVRAALALNCEVRRFSRFARKNYFYPDLPKGYQISQYDKPLAEHGALEIVVDGASKRIGITRVHLEDDAGKSIHDGFPDSDRHSYVDLNRSGVPLIEIVSEPDLRSSAEAYAYLTELKLILQYIGVSTCDMEKGHLRCDANVSVRPRGAEKFGVKTEVKNLNSFRYLQRALDYEIGRQVAVIENGGAIGQETRLFNAATGETVGMRSKEHAHDYRYFPEPDLLPLAVSDAWRDAIRAEMPELPAAKRTRWITKYSIREYDARVLTQTPQLADYYEGTATKSGQPDDAAKWVMGELLGALNAEGKTIDQSPITDAQLADLVALSTSGTLSGKLAKDVFAKMFATGRSAPEIIEAEGLQQISDAGEIERIVDEILAANPKQLETYRAGKKGVLGFFVGQVMKATRGQANPAVVNELLARKLG